LESLWLEYDRVFLCDDFHEFYFGTGITIYPGTADCHEFLKRFPNYRWLERQNLHDGYFQGTDAKGNVIQILYLAPQYQLDQLYQQINTLLRPQLSKYHETDYRKFRHIQEHIKSKTSSLESKQALDRNISILLETLDNSGEKWTVYRQGEYYSALFTDVLQANQFKNFAGALTAEHENRSGKLGHKRSYRGIRYVLLAILEEEVYNQQTIDDILEITGFRVKILSSEELFNNSEFLKMLHVCDINKILKHTTTNAHYTHARLVRTLKKIKLYTIAKTLKRLFHKFVTFQGRRGAI